MVKQRKTAPTIEQIAAAVSKVTGISIEIMRSKYRGKKISASRQIVMYLARKYAKPKNASWPRILFKDIGLYFNRDHSTVMFGCKTVKNMIDTAHPDYMDPLNAIDEKFIRIFEHQSAAA